MHTISSYHGNRPAHTLTNRQDRLQYTAPQLARNVARRQLSPTDRASVQYVTMAKKIFSLVYRSVNAEVPVWSIRFCDAKF